MQLPKLDLYIEERRPEKMLLKWKKPKKLPLQVVRETQQVVMPVQLTLTLLELKEEPTLSQQLKKSQLNE
jgi:hypothetical protein